MMHWDYRVFLEDSGYTFRTVYYDDNGAITACSQPIEPFGESLEELQEELNILQEALKKKVLCPADIPSQTVPPKVKRGKSLQAVRASLGLTSEAACDGSLTAQD